MLPVSVFVTGQIDRANRDPVLPLQVLHGQPGATFMLVQALPRPQKVGPDAEYEGKCLPSVYDPAGRRTGRDRHGGVKAGEAIGQTALRHTGGFNVSHGSVNSGH